MLHSPAVAGPIFIIGCARSGTTWLGTIFAESAGFHATIEHPLIFPLVDEAVLDGRRRASVLERLIPLYGDQIARAGDRLYVDKSHQNLWLAEELALAFPTSRFVGIERCAYGVIASMMRHPHVRLHFETWRRYPVPNPYLGIGAADAPGYDALPLSIKCALRWRANHHRLAGLRRTLGDRLRMVRYENFVEDQEATLADLACFVGRPLGRVAASRASLDRWRGILSRRQIDQIDRVLGGIA